MNRLTILENYRDRLDEEIDKLLEQLENTEDEEEQDYINEQLKEKYEELEEVSGDIADIEFKWQEHEYWETQF